MTIIRKWLKHVECLRVMEKAKNVYVVVGNFDWSDVGSWDAVYDIMKKDENNNLLIGDITALDTKGCCIYSRKNNISTIGVKDLIIIQSKDSILIVHQNESERVKELVDLLLRSCSGNSGRVRIRRP